jgi:hypothetical protein
MCSIAFHCFQPSPPHANRRLSPAPHRTLDPSIFTEPGARRSLAGRFGGGGGRFRWPWRAPTRSEISSALLLFFSSAKSFTYICCLPPLSSIPLRLQLCYVRVEWLAELVRWCCGSSVFLLSREAVRIYVAAAPLLLLLSSVDVGGVDSGRSASSASTCTRFASSSSLLFDSPSTPLRWNHRRLHPQKNPSCLLV